MAVFKSNDNNNELIVTCGCCCDESMRITIWHNHPDDYAFIGYLNGRFYSEQECGVLGTIKKKFKKIWAILMNKDYYYSDIRMNKAEFETFKEWIHRF